MERQSNAIVDDPSTIALLIVADHDVICENWALIFKLERRFKVVGACGSGVGATREICKYARAAEIIGVCLHSQPFYARKIMQQGASGYVTKSSSKDELYHGITHFHGKKIHLRRGEK